MCQTFVLLTIDILFLLVYSFKDRVGDVLVSTILLNARITLISLFDFFSVQQQLSIQSVHPVVHTAHQVLCCRRLIHSVTQVSLVGQMRQELYPSLPIEVRLVVVVSLSQILELYSLVVRDACSRPDLRLHLLHVYLLLVVWVEEGRGADLLYSLNSVLQIIVNLNDHLRLLVNQLDRLWRVKVLLCLRLDYICLLGDGLNVMLRLGMQQV